MRAFLYQTHFHLCFARSTKHYRHGLIFSLQKRDVTGTRHKDTCTLYEVRGMELKPHRKILLQKQYLNQTFAVCILVLCTKYEVFLSRSNGCFLDSTLKIMTNNLRAMASSAFCDFIRPDNCRYFFPRNDLLDNAAAQAT